MTTLVENIEVAKAILENDRSSAALDTVVKQMSNLGIGTTGESHHVAGLSSNVALCRSSTATKVPGRS
jgi:hypothetical protein